MSSVLPWKMGFILPEKLVFYRKRKEFILDWKVSVLSRKGAVLRLKSQCFAAKKGVIFKLENKDEYYFFQWVRESGLAFDDSTPGGCPWIASPLSVMELTDHVDWPWHVSRVCVSYRDDLYNHVSLPDVVQCNNIDC